VILPEFLQVVLLHELDATLRIGGSEEKEEENNFTCFNNGLKLKNKVRTFIK